MIVQITGRVAGGWDGIEIGVEGDNLVTEIVFAGVPEIGPDQLVTLHWVAAKPGADAAGDIMALTAVEDGWRAEIASTITQYADRAISAYLQAQAGAKVWHSHAFALRLSDLPGADEAATPPTPTIIDQMLAAIQAHIAAMDAQEARVEGLVSEAGEARTEAQEARDRAEEYAGYAAEDRADAQEAATRASERADDAEGWAKYAETGIKVVTFEVSEAGDLLQHMPDGQTNLLFALNDSGELEVTINGND